MSEDGERLAVLETRVDNHEMRIARIERLILSIGAAAVAAIVAYLMKEAGIL